MTRVQLLMPRNRFLTACVLLAVAVPMTAQETFGHIMRGDGEATLTVFDSHSMEADTVNGIR